MSVEALRTRTYDAEPFVTVKSVSGTSAFSRTVIEYRSDGNRIFALLYEPLARNPKGKFPVIIVNHGYIPPASYSTVDSYNNISSHYARAGFLVFKPDYRGHGTSEGEVSSPFRTVFYSIDVLNLIEAIKGYERADMDNLFMFGHSMGGEVTLRVLEITNAVKAATLWAPVSVRFPENTLYFIRQSGGSALADFEEAIEREIEPSEYGSVSPIEHLDYIRVPLVLHHGTADESVPFEWSTRLVEAFDAHGVRYEFHPYEGENHNLVKKYSATVRRRDVDFFTRFID